MFNILDFSTSVDCLSRLHDCKSGHLNIAISDGSRISCGGRGSVVIISVGINISHWPTPRDDNAEVTAG